MTRGLRFALILVAAVVTTPVAAAPKRPDCGGSLASVQAAVTAACDCDTARNHGRFVRCAVRVVKGLVTDGTLDRRCRGAMMRGFAKSICGRPDATTCCMKSRCAVKRPSVCARLGGTPGATDFCADACLPGSALGAFVE